MIKQQKRATQCRTNEAGMALSVKQDNCSVLWDAQQHTHKQGLKINQSNLNVDYYQKVCLCTPKEIADAYGLGLPLASDMK